MITIQLLEADDAVDPEDWCRPLSLRSMSGGHSDGYSFRCQYSGKPENNVEWVQVKYILGNPWYGRTVKQIDLALGKYVKYEFVRGDMPERSQLDLTGYTIIDHTKIYEKEDKE